MALLHGQAAGRRREELEVERLQDGGRRAGEELRRGFLGDAARAQRFRERLDARREGIGAPL